MNPGIDVMEDSRMNKFFMLDEPVRQEEADKNNDPTLDKKEKHKRDNKNRWLVALIMIIVCVPAIVFGGYVFAIACAIIEMFCVFEIIRVPGKKYPWYVYVVMYIAVLAFTFWFVLKSNLGALADVNYDFSQFHFSLEEYFNEPFISTIALVITLIAYAFIAIVSSEFSWHDVIYFFSMSLVLGLGFQCLLFMRYFPFHAYAAYVAENPTYAIGINNGLGDGIIESHWFRFLISTELLVFVAVGTMLNDAGAYWVGSAFGKHKMNPRLSPNKSWEGFFGGWAVGFIACLAVGILFSALNYPLIPAFSMRDGNLLWLWLIPLSLIIPFVSDLGDLFFSMIKRNYGVKDFGRILQGHGGMVDRIGSLLFTSMATMALLVFIENGWNFIH